MGVLALIGLSVLAIAGVIALVIGLIESVSALMWTGGDIGMASFALVPGVVIFVIGVAMLTLAVKSAPFTIVWHL